MSEEQAVYARSGTGMRTASGLRFYPDDPQPEGVAIGDIGHALGNLCRFGGHCPAFYSVAEHSVLVASEARGIAAALGWSGRDLELIELCALLHDAHEAY